MCNEILPEKEQLFSLLLEATRLIKGFIASPMRLAVPDLNIIKLRFEAEDYLEKYEKSISS